jgi:hypothetical protein
VAAWTPTSRQAAQSGAPTHQPTSRSIISSGDYDVYFGFGFEAITTQGERDEVMGRAMDDLLGP